MQRPSGSAVDEGKTSLVSSLERAQSKWLYGLALDCRHSEICCTEDIQAASFSTLSLAEPCQRFSHVTGSGLCKGTVWWTWQGEFLDQSVELANLIAMSWSLHVSVTWASVHLTKMDLEIQKHIYHILSSYLRSKKGKKRAPNLGSSAMPIEAPGLWHPLPWSETCRCVIGLLFEIVEHRWTIPKTIPKTKEFGEIWRYFKQRLLFMLKAFWLRLVLQAQVYKLCLVWSLFDLVHWLLLFRYMTSPAKHRFREAAPILT